MIIQDINTTKIYVIEFFHESKIRWHPKKQTRPRATSIDLVFIKELMDDEMMEQHFVDA